MARLTTASLRVGLLVVIAILPRVAAAQPPSARQLQLAFGYSAMDDVTDHVTLPRGWFIGAAAPVNRWLAVFVEADGQYKSIHFIDSDIALTSHAFVGGMRAAAPLGRFLEFIQLGAAAVQSRGTLFGSTETVWHFLLQPGAGLDYPLSERWAIRGEFDVRFLKSGESGHELRAAAGLVRRFSR